MWISAHGLMLPALWCTSWWCAFFCWHCVRACMRSCLGGAAAARTCPLPSKDCIILTLYTVFWPRVVCCLCAILAREGLAVGKHLVGGSSMLLRLPGCLSPAEGVCADRQLMYRLSQGVLCSHRPNHAAERAAHSCSVNVSKAASGGPGTGKGHAMCSSCSTHMCRPCAAR